MRTQVELSETSEVQKTLTTLTGVFGEFLSRIRRIASALVHRVRSLYVPLNDNPFRACRSYSISAVFLPTMPATGAICAASAVRTVRRRPGACRDGQADSRLPAGQAGAADLRTLWDQLSDAGGGAMTRRGARSLDQAMNASAAQRLHGRGSPVADATMRRPPQQRQEPPSRARRQERQRQPWSIMQNPKRPILSANTS